MDINFKGIGAIITYIIIAIVLGFIIGYNWVRWFGGTKKTTEPVSVNNPTPWRWCSRREMNTWTDMMASARGEGILYNPDGTIFKNVVYRDEIGYWVANRCDWAIISTPDGEKYIHEKNVMWHVD